MRPYQGLRACLSAGEKLSEEIRERFRNSTGHEIYEGLRNDGAQRLSCAILQPGEIVKTPAANRFPSLGSPCFAKI